MKLTLLFATLCCVLLLFTEPAKAQWRCLYSTYDDDTNGTGHNTTSFGLIAEDSFVALIMTTNVRNFMIPYVNADSAQGRVNFAGYGGATANIFQVWSDGGFDQVEMRNARRIVTTPDSTVYVANNDPDHNILIFKFTGDTVDAVEPFLRQPTGSNGIFGLAVDGNGFVYVCNDTSVGKTDDLKIYNPIAQWSAGHDDSPVRTLDLPDGNYRGITVTPNGSSLFVADYDNRSIHKFVGSPATGYTQDTGFNFVMGDGDTVAGATTLPSVIGLAYYPAKNILLAACDRYLGGGTFYSYGRVYLINPFTGALISDDSTMSVLDIAKWNFDMTGGYNLRSGGTVPGNASGYTSVYDVKVDENGNVYTQSHYGWTVDKWTFDGTLPVITSVERLSPEIPQSFRLEQNYPNPFNPTTNIDFSLDQAGHVTLRIYDMLGREVDVLVDIHMNVGTYRAQFDARDLPGGTYFYSLRTNGSVQTKKMILIK